MDKLTVASHEARLSLWLERIRACKSSGLSVKEWCKQNGLTDKNYYYWMRKIKREAFETLQEQASVEEIPFQKKTVFSQISLPVSYTESTGTAAILHINGIRIEIQNGASANTIHALLSTVQTLC